MPLTSTLNQTLDLLEPGLLNHIVIYNSCQTHLCPNDVSSNTLEHVNNTENPSLLKYVPRDLTFTATLREIDQAMRNESSAPKDGEETDNYQ